MKLKEKRIKIGNKIIKISSRTQIIVFITAIIICVSIGFIINKNNGINLDIFSPQKTESTISPHGSVLESEASNVTIPTSNDETVTPTIEPTPNPEICVHVSGAVKNPGLVSLDINSRVNDAVNAAGGTTKNANLDGINLAEYVYDGSKIHIPSNGESPAVIHSTKMPSSPTPNKESSKVTENSSKININTASLEELIALNGIGNAIAQNIVEYREKNGNFNSIEEILNVSGIGDSKFEKIKEFICI